MKWIILFGFVALVQSESTILDTIKTANNFCKMKVCPKGTSSIACSFIKSTDMSCTDGTILDFDEVAVLKKHNDYRQKLASGALFPLYLTAARMIELQYSDELAQMALYNAKQCQLKHDDCRSTNTFPLAGQNIDMIPWNAEIDIDKTVAKLLDRWFNEYKLGNMSQIKNLIDYITIGRFTQIVQEKNTHIGCAVSSFVANGETQLLLVCNYGYGNLSPIYTSGASASKCTKKSTNFKSLCSA